MEAGDALQGRDQAVGCGQVALDDLDAGREVGRRRIPGEGADRVAAGEQFGDDLTATLTCSTVACLGHQVTAGTSEMRSRRRLLPSRMTAMQRIEFLAVINTTPRTVTWSSFRQPFRREWGELPLGPYVFARPAYATALAEPIRVAEDPLGHGR